MTIGDILAVIAAVFLVGATWAATILLTALAFPVKAAQAQAKIVAAPGASLARGLALFLLIGLLAAAFWSHPGPARLIGGAFWALLGTLAAVGSAGIARLVSERIQAVGSHMNPFATLTRGTILYVAAGFLPIIGWFLVAPIALLLSLGGGVAALWGRKEAPPAPNTGGARVEEAISPAPPLLGAGGATSAALGSSGPNTLEPVA